MKNHRLALVTAVADGMGRGRLPDGAEQARLHTTAMISPRRAMVGLRKVCRTPGISCEAVPAFEVDRRGHEAALRPSNGAAESFVSFIPLFDGSVFRPR
jgi:hypothetical protein